MGRVHDSNVRRIAQDIAALKRDMRVVKNRKPGLAHSSIEDGAIREYDKDGVLVSQSGKQPDGTHNHVVVNGPKPPKPAGLTASTQPGLIEIRWNGKFAGGAVSPLDLKHVAAYVVPSGEFLDLSDQAGVMTGELGDNIQVQVTAGGYTVYLVAWSLAGKFSDAAGPAPVLVTPPADPIEIQGALDDLNERYDGVITEAGNLGNRLNQAEHELTEHDQRLGKNETDVNEALAGDVDIDRLAIGNGVIRDLVAQHIAGKTAAFQEVDIKNLFVTTGTLTEAVINRLWTEVVMSRKITAQMMAIGSFDNLVPDPSFESWGETGGRDWRDDDAGYVTVSNEAGAARTGNWGMKFASDVPRSTNSYYHDAYISVGAGEYFKAGLHYKVAAGAGSARIRFYEYNSAGTYLRSALGGEDELSAAGWTKTQYARQVSADASYIRIRMYFTATAANTVIYADDVYCNRMNAGELLVDGAVTAEKVAANAIKAYHADFDSFFANTGFVSQLRSKGIILLDETGAETVNLTGEGENFITIRDGATGDDLVTIDESGGMSAQSLAVVGEARMDGAVVTGGDPISGGHGSGEFGVTMNGRDMLGATFMNYVEQHPNVADGNAWLTVIPHGVVAHQEVSTPNQGWNATGGIDHCRIRAVVTLNAVYGRMYQITYRTPAVKETSNVGGTIGGAHLVYSAPNGSIAAGASGNRSLTGSRYYLRGGDGFDQAMVTTYARCPEDIPEGKIMLGPEVYVYSGRAAVATDVNATARWSVVVADLGMRRSSYTGRDIDSNKQGTAPPPAPTPDPDPVKRYFEEVPASWWQAYTGNNSQATHSTYAGAAAQGRTPYAPGNGVMRGLVGFPSQASRLSGATVKKIEVYVYAKSWHASAGGTAVLGVHGHGSKPSTWSSTTDNVTYQKMKRPEGRWITLPSSVHAGFKSGALRGVSFLPPNGSTSTEYYGIFTGNKTKLRITYEK